MVQQTAKSAVNSAAAPPRQQGSAAPAVLPSRPKRDFVEAIWTLFCSVRFAVVLNVSLALAAVLGTVIPQMSPGLANFPSDYSSFLDDARSRYGDASPLLYWAGFYDIYNSLWFRILVVLVVFSIVMCTLNRWGPIVRLIRQPVVKVGEGFVNGLSEKALFKAVPASQGAVEDALSQALKKGRYRTVIERTDDGVTHLYADRDRWTKLVTFVSHGALVTLILVAAGMMSFGWREQSVVFYPGVPVDIGHGVPFTVRNDHFSIDYYADGQTVKEYKDTLTVIENGKDVLTKTIIVNDPLRYKGVNYFLVSYQPVLFAKVTDSANHTLALRSMGAAGPVTDTTTSGETLVKFKYTSQDNLPLDYVQLPAQGHILTLEMTYYQDVQRNPGENPPAYVRAYVDQNFDKTIYDGFLPRTGPLKVPGYEQYAFTFRPDMATYLEVAKDPGLGPIVAIFLVMTTGFAISLYTTFTRCWAKITPNPDRPGTVNVLLGGLAEKNKVSFEQDFERLATRVRERLGVAASATVASDLPSEEPVAALDAAEA